VTVSPPTDGLFPMFPIVRITDTSYNISDLAHDISYTVTVTGSNDAGMGESSEMRMSTFCR